MTKEELDRLRRANLLADKIKRAIHLPMVKSFIYAFHEKTKGIFANGKK